MKNWAILFVKTDAEEKLARLLRERLSADEYLPFLPTKEVHRVSRGVARKERKLLFPGYLFVQTEIEAYAIAARLRGDLTSGGNWPEGIYSLLHYGDDENDVAVKEPERAYWEKLLDDDFCITGSIGFIEGDTITVISGPLVGREGKIKRINRHKREAVVELDVMGAARNVRLMLEIVAKHKNV